MTHEPVFWKRWLKIQNREQNSKETVQEKSGLLSYYGSFILGYYVYRHLFIIIKVFLRQLQIK